MSTGVGFRTTVYDSLGYVVPGICMMAVLWLYTIPFVGVKTAVAGAEVIVTYGAPFWIFGLLGAYILGQLVNSLSYLIFEDISLVRRFALGKQFKDIPDWSSYIDSDTRDQMRKKFNTLFGCKPYNGDWLAIVSYLDEHAHGAAFTALRFQAFYGMNRSLALISFLALPWPLVMRFSAGWGCNIFIALALILAIAVFIRQFRQFVQYHRQFLAGSLIMLSARVNQQ